MTNSTVHHPWAFAFGILGNIISFMVILSPLPTFYRVYKKKSTEGFQSIPYVVALFSSMLWIYYAILKSDAYLLITINSLGCIIESIYITIFIIYAPKKARMYTAKLLVLLNLGLFCLILVLTLLLSQGSTRVRILGWVCVAFSASVFAAPLSIMALVIRTKSVEFMPFSLSLFLTLSAVVWFFYGLLLKDLYVCLPNVIGFIFGMLQMVLYVIYKDSQKAITEQENKLSTADGHQQNISELGAVRLRTMLSSDIHPIDLQAVMSSIEVDSNGFTDQKPVVSEQTEQVSQLNLQVLDDHTEVQLSDHCN